MIEAWKNCPLPIIPKAERVDRRTISICKGSCNRMIKIDNVKYNLCEDCTSKYRYYGESCDVPKCQSIVAHRRVKEGKLTCGGCFAYWKRANFCQWERLVEERHLHFLRPITFTSAEKEGLISKVEIPIYNSKRCGKKYTCHGCEREMIINNPIYQLCTTCSMQYKFWGEICGCCEVNDAMIFDTQESMFACMSCSKMKSSYNLESYQIYKTQIRSIKNCMICDFPVSHNKVEGSDRKSSCLDHNHDTGDTRGVLCVYCNVIEGMIKRIDISPYAYAKRLKDYLGNPPLSQSWIQKS